MRCRCKIRATEPATGVPVASVPSLRASRRDSQSPRSRKPRADSLWSPRQAVGRVSDSEPLLVRSATARVVDIVSRLADRKLSSSKGLSRAPTEPAVTRLRRVEAMSEQPGRTDLRVSPRSGVESPRQQFFFFFFFRLSFSAEPKYATHSI